MTIVSDCLIAMPIFQLTSSRRGWQSQQFSFKRQLTFQLTSSRRGWQQTIWSMDMREDFNSHPHEEDDVYNQYHVPYTTCISTHILTKRMTYAVGITEVDSIFQLTSSRRGWQSHLSMACLLYLFQLTSSRRGWRLLASPLVAWNHFNSHPHEEDDSNFKQK